QQGSRFGVGWRACLEEPPHSEPPPTSIPPPPKLSVALLGVAPKVLVIDDEPMIRSLVKRLLSGRFRVTTVDGVRSALATLNQASDYDAILCDLMMPGESG